MALVRKIKTTGHTFESYADQVLYAAIMSGAGASWIDIVFDVYRENSIKNAERVSRESRKFQVKRIVGGQYIKQFPAFLSSGMKKMALIRFLVSRWESNNACIGNTKVYVGNDEICFLLGDGDIAELCWNHEEVDTRLLFHVQHNAKSFETIVIHTLDTDVFLIALGVSGEINEAMFIQTGVQNKTCIISLAEVKKALKINYGVQDIDLASKPLLGLHGFTGCDTISSFAGKGKVKPVKVMMSNESYLNMFASFGNEPKLSEDQFLVIQKFVCHLYGHQDQYTNMVRYKMYAAKHGHLDPKSIPPCADSLRQHSLCALYQVHIWRKSLESHPQIPSPIDFGWDQNEDGHFVIA